MRLVAILVLAVPAVVQADRPLSRAAAAHDTRGRELYRDKDYAGAAHEFEAAYAIDPAPQLLYHWAQAERLGGRCDHAIQLYHRYIDDGARGGASADDVRSLVKQCESAQLDAPRAPPRESPPIELRHDAQPPWYRDRLAVGLAGGGVVALGVGIGLLVASGSTRAAANSAFYLDDHVRLLATANNERTAGGLTLGLAAALVGAGAYVFVVHRRHHDAAVTFTASGLAIAGSF